MSSLDNSSRSMARTMANLENAVPKSMQPIHSESRAQLTKLISPSRMNSFSHPWLDDDLLFTLTACNRRFTDPDWCAQFDILVAIEKDRIEGRFRANRSVEVKRALFGSDPHILEHKI